ncbi:hypothetical protein PGB28_16295 [Primorskyibacter aestuariivivens]|uniref:hypothetical protein n=1 Tax=Primorskyibacter aestuariivivens TaxID=1888912 RepID=UPI00230170E4|nr:hypothetical protein [Primorskyibacter aestuariivivens]MDA7430027.1 hypothetical protein [Primorskyibacter aestuariivivens]
MTMIVSEKFVVVKVAKSDRNAAGDMPDDAVLEITDGGETYAIVPAGTGREAMGAALEDPDTGELAIPTARLTLRAPLGDAGVRAELEKAGARIIRDYGRGGMVEAPDEAAARALSEALEKLPEVQSASQQILRPRAFKR